VTFVDSSAWYSYLVPTDAHHPAAVAWMAANNGPLLTTDYVVDETLTLLRSRGHRDRALSFGNWVYGGSAGRLRLLYLTVTEIAAAWDVFRRFADKDWSFTDCTSKVVIEALGVPEAFAFDHHFRQFGTVAVVP
jgi:predicted nucleic acid-binding protein